MTLKYSVINVIIMGSLGWVGGGGGSSEVWGGLIPASTKVQKKHLNQKL